MPPTRYKEILHLRQICQAPEKRRKTNLPHKTIASNKATKKARQAHFSKLIQDNKNNPKVLSDFYINPGLND